MSNNYLLEVKKSQEDVKEKLQEFDEILATLEVLASKNLITQKVANDIAHACQKYYW